MKLFRRRKRKFKLVKSMIALGALAVGAGAVSCLAVRGLILAFFWNKRTAALPKALRILRHFI